MNLFLPGGYSGYATSFSFGKQGVPAVYPLSQPPDGIGLGTSSFYNLKLPISSFVSLSVYFGVTQYLYGSLINKQAVILNYERLAVVDGILRISLLGPQNQVITSAEAPFDRNTFKTQIILTDVGSGYAAGTDYKLQWQYVSQSNRPFGDIEFISSISQWGVTLVEPNQTLVAKTYNIGQQINYGPEASATATANLTEAEIINLRAAPEATAVVFSNAEIDEELNLRGGLSATAASSANLLGPAPLSAEATAVGVTTGSATFIVAMAASAESAGSARAVPYIGTTILLEAAATATAATKPTQNLLVSSRVSGMTIYVNLDTREFVVSPVLIAPISQMYFTRRDIEAVDVKFVRNGEVVELSYGSTGQLGIKSEFDGAALALDSEWSQKGFGSDATYQFSLNLNTQELDDLFVTDDEASVSAKVELQWTEGGTINTTLPCAAVILNDVLRGTEGAPTLATSNSFNLSDGSGGVWTVTIDANGILTTTKV